MDFNECGPQGWTEDTADSRVYNLWKAEKQHDVTSEIVQLSQKQCVGLRHYCWKKMTLR